MNSVLHKFYRNFFSPKRKKPFVYQKDAKRVHSKLKNKGADEECGLCLYKSLTWVRFNATWKTTKEWLEKEGNFPFKKGVSDMKNGT